MEATLRDSSFGWLLRFLTGNKILLYPEERADFQCPAAYASPDVTSESSLPSSGSQSPLEKPLDHAAATTTDEPEKLRATKSADEHFGHPTEATATAEIPTESALSSDVEAGWTEDTEATLKQEISRPITPARTKDGTILVDWYTTDDPENPQNWSTGKKAFVTFLICFYTLAFYMGSAIYTPSAPYLSQIFHVGNEVTSLGLSLYVLAYGLGPLLFSPLSEIPSVGRNPPYVISFGIFVILCVPTALVNNIPGLLVLRFLQGFFGSPCLATGGATLQDMYPLHKLPYILCLWALAATCGPALGPTISGFSVPAENWHWSLWEILWVSGPILLTMIFFLPETSSANILLRRAARLRKLTGNPHLLAQSEIDQANSKTSDIVYEALVRPWLLIFMDPAIGYTAFYTGLSYGIYYSFFEAFPLVYVDLYKFNLGQMGLTFLSITVGVIIAISIYYAYLHWIVKPHLIKNGMGAPEYRLKPALISSFFLPLGLFLFGWTGNGSINWSVSVVGIMFFTIGVFILLQCIFLYLAMVYPQYSASLFAGNDAARSLVAFAAVMFGRPMYVGMGIGPACSLLGALTAGCIVGIFVLYFYGARLRARSRFSGR